MGETYEEITPQLAEWIGRQRMFFVATAPLDGGGLINCSPKGLDTLRLLGPRELVYLDLTGSGVETIAHLRENGRIVIMFCSVEDPPKILRLHGRGEVIPLPTPEGQQLSRLFGSHPGARSVIRVRVTRVGDSCGWGVPRYTYESERDALGKWAEAKGPAGITEYQQKKNARSLDGLPGL